MITATIIALLIAIVAGIFMLWIGAKKDTLRTNNSAFKMFLVIFGVAFLVWGLMGSLNQLGVFTLPSNYSPWFLSASTVYIPSGGTGNNGGTNTGTNVQTYQPTKSYSTLNHFSSASVGGTSYYKEGSSKATTTAITSTNPGTEYQYWVSNATGPGYYVKPLTFSGTNTQAVSNSEAYQNGSLSITGWDMIGQQKITSGLNNASLSAGTSKLQFTVQGAATTSNIPFGGVFVLETNSTVSGIACSGDGLLGLNNKYQVTYQPAATNTRNIIYEVASGYDVSPNGLQGVTKTITCDFTSATNPGVGAPIYVRFIPANYYYVNSDGSFALDVEQKSNGATTRTNLGGTLATFYWG